VIVNESCLEHPFATAVTPIVAITGDEPLFIVTNDGIFPLPLAPRPIEVLLFVHVMAAPGVKLEKLKLPVFTPGQKLAAEGMERSATPLTLNCLVTVVVPHSFVTASETVCTPTVENSTHPGFTFVELPNAPPSNNH
jgi:hypothetical protein